MIAMGTIVAFEQAMKPGMRVKPSLDFQSPCTRVQTPHLVLRPTTALFLQGDEIDEWDGLAVTLHIENIPTVKFIRGGGISPWHVIAEIQGRGPNIWSSISGHEASQTAVAHSVLVLV
jgi:hypothetical protein